MMLVWFIIEVLFVFMFFSLPGVVETTSLNETTPFVTKKEQHVINSSVSSSSHKHGKISCSMRLWTLVREETVVLLAVLFVVMFNQTAIEVGYIINLREFKLFCY